LSDPTSDRTDPSARVRQAFLDAAGPPPTGTALVLGADPAGLLAAVEDRPGWRGVGVTTTGRAFRRGARAVARAGGAALPLRSDAVDAVVADHVPERLAALGPTAAELARVCRSDGLVVLALDGRGHQAELRALVTDAATIGAAWTAGRCTYEDAVAGGLEPAIEVTSGVLHRDELVVTSTGAVMTAIQELRSALEPRLRGFVNWTMVLARSREALGRELREKGEWRTTLELGVVVGRARPLTPLGSEAPPDGGRSR
jgi:SAM-dependent methyltransferase